jgi:hypothetical protein
VECPPKIGSPFHPFNSVANGFAPGPRARQRIRDVLDRPHTEDFASGKINEVWIGISLRIKPGFDALHLIGILDSSLFARCDNQSSFPNSQRRFRFSLLKLRFRQLHRLGGTRRQMNLHERLSGGL